MCTDKYKLDRIVATRKVLAEWYELNDGIVDDLGVCTEERRIEMQLFVQPIAEISVVFLRKLVDAIDDPKVKEKLDREIMTDLNSRYEESASRVNDLTMN